MTRKRHVWGRRAAEARNGSGLGVGLKPATTGWVRKGASASNEILRLRNAAPRMKGGG